MRKTGYPTNTQERIAWRLAHFSGPLSFYTKISKITIDR